MSRPLKKGLTYFPFDVDIFQDGKIRRLRSRYGNDGIIAYIYLLCSVYSSEGYYLNYDDDFLELMADDLKMSVNNIGQILNYLLSRSLFDNTLFQSVKVLSSTGIQRRYQEAIKNKALKNPVTVNKKFWLLSEDETQSYIKFYLNESYSEKNYNNSEKNPNYSMEKLHKEKESKLNKNKLNKRESIIDDYVSVPSIPDSKSKTHNDAVASPSSRFIKPTIQDIRAYCLERHNNVDPEVFFDFYESKNWMIGKSKMKDWRAAVRTWEKRQIQDKKEEIKNPYMRSLIEINEYERSNTGFISDIFSISDNG